MRVHWLDFSNTHISRDRSIWNYGKVQWLVGHLVRNSRRQLRSLDPGARYLNAGCGPKPLSDFINLDWKWGPEIERCWDLTKALPLKSGSLDGVYSEHCVEHFTRENAVKILREFHRVLRPGSIVRIVVPDVELFIDLYVRARNGEPVSFPYVEDPGPSFTPVDPLNRIFRGYGHHLYAYDAHALAVLMLEAGFRQPEKRAFLEGRDAKLLVDSPERQCESLYMEAVR